MRRRPFVLAALLAGLASGTVVAAAAQDDPRVPARATGDLPPITEAPARRPVTRLPDGRYSPGFAHYLVERGSVRIAATLDDPDGEPAWAIRTYVAERRIIKRAARTLDDYSYRQVYRCVELGRVLNGRFGWVYGDRRFRPFEPGDVFELQQCTSRRRPEAVQQMDATLAFPSPSEPRPARGAVWGLAPPGARAARFKGRRLDLHGGAFLTLTRPGATGTDVRYRLRGGSTERGTLDPSGGMPGLGGSVPGTARIEARVPDPAGGPGWGVPVADHPAGGVCVGAAGQVVGDEVGHVDPDLALFDASGPVECRPPGDGPTPGRPVWPSYGWGDDAVGRGPDPLLSRARIERRVLTGRFSLQAECDPSVDRVTIRSPRDIRTLVPSKRGHVVFALYDDMFPAGQIVITAHLRGGGRRIERLPLF